MNNTVEILASLGVNVERYLQAQKQARRPSIIRVDESTYEELGYRPPPEKTEVSMKNVVQEKRKRSRASYSEFFE